MPIVSGFVADTGDTPGAAPSESGVKIKNLEWSGWGASGEHPAATRHAPTARKIVFMFVFIIDLSPAHTFRAPMRQGYAADSWLTPRWPAKCRRTARAPDSD